MNYDDMPREELIGLVRHLNDTLEIFQKQEKLSKKEFKKKYVIEHPDSLWKNVLDNLPLIVFINDSSESVWINKFVQNQAGYTPEEWLAFSVEERAGLFHPEDMKKNSLAVAKLVEEGKDPNAAGFEYRVKYKDGNWHWNYSTYSYIFDPEANGYKALGTALDIDRLKNIEESLKISEENYRLVVENMNAGLFQTTISGEFLQLNQAMVEMSGYGSIEELMSKSVEILYANPEDRDILKQELLINGEVKNYEVNVIHKDGTKHWVSLNAVIQKDKNGNPEKILGIANDITKRKTSQDIINQKNRELAELNASKDKFFSIISHDLRSPFAGFLGLTKLMAENINNFTLSELHEQSRNMQASASNLYQLLENLLEWSLMQRGLKDFNPNNYTLSQIVKLNIEIASNYASRKNINLIHKVPEQIKVIADLPMLDSILRNLISNAIKYTPRTGTIEIGAWVSNGKTKPEIFIYVKDSGVGIKQDKISRLFRIGEKVSHPGTDDEPSSGLGLLLCKEFVNIHNGRIWVESEIGKGSTFYFTLPGVKA